MRRALSVRLVVTAALVTTCGCSLRTTALRALADSVAEPGNTYSRDDDPELVRDSLPVMLKLMEQLRDGLPDHKPIRLALVRSFTSFGVAFVQDDAERLSEASMERGKEKYGRARKLLLRGYGYGLEGLDLAVPGFKAAFARGSHVSMDEKKRLVSLVKKEDTGLLYWSAAALGSAVACAKDDMNLVGEMPTVELLMTRALELDEAYEEGAVHEFFIIDDMTRGVGRGGGPDSARKHYLRARELGERGGKGKRRLSPIVTYAEAVLVDQQKKQEFVKLLDEVVAWDVDQDLDHRLVNVLAQRRARWLLSRTSDLFAE